MRRATRTLPFLTLLLTPAISLALGGCASGKNRNGGLEKAWSRAFERTTKQLDRELVPIGSTLDALAAQAQRQWGRAEARVVERTVFVKYTQDYHARAIADFDRGTVTVETTDDRDPQGSLRKAIVTTLLTSSDPRAVDVFSDRNVELQAGRNPYLYGLVHDREGQPVRTAEQAERFAAHLVETRSRTHVIQTEPGPKTVRSVKIPMVASFASRNAQKYRPAVLRHAERFQVSPSLVFAIIRAESSFNPFAVSHIPAFGLMQLVPRTGGRDAYRRAKGVDETPSPEYLFVPENNIELGTAYLDVLSSGYLAKIANPVSREYCVIAAYNTGSGNVFRAFGKDRLEALDAINELDPAGVLARLRTSLPNRATGDYLAKVLSYRRQYMTKAGTSLASAPASE